MEHLAAPQAAREGLSEVAVQQVETHLGLAWATGCLLFGLMVGGTDKH